MRTPVADDRFGRWAPLTIAEARREFDDCPARWWFSGGVALEMFAGRSWRAHDDVDIGVCRRDAVTVLDHLRRRGWEVVVAAAGSLTAWDGGALSESSHQNNVWSRRPDGAWAFDVTIGAGDDGAWSYRRDRAITRPWAEAVHERDGIRFLAPELQLLFKSKDVRPKDTVDAEQVVPLLAGGGLALLAGQLRGQQHPWRSLVQTHVLQCSAADVHHMLDLFVAAGLDVWVDGGWAVDALLGEQTRPHADLDLAITRADFDAALRLLGRHGFRTIRDDGRHIQVVADDEGRIVDLHAFDPTVTSVDAGGIRRHGGDGLAFEADGFDGRGTIDGRGIACIAPATLVRYHTGYEVDADDWHDVRLLCERFDLPIPADYQPFQRR